MPLCAFGVMQFAAHLYTPANLTLCNPQYICILLRIYRYAIRNTCKLLRLWRYITRNIFVYPCVFVVMKFATIWYTPVQLVLCNSQYFCISLRIWRYETHNTCKLLCIWRYVTLKIFLYLCVFGVMQTQHFCIPLCISSHATRNTFVYLCVFGIMQLATLLYFSLCYSQYFCVQLVATKIYFSFIFVCNSANKFKT